MQDTKMIELVIRAQKHEEDAFIELYQNYHNLVLSQAYKATNSYVEAQDIAQEVFLQVYKSIHTLREPNLFPLWLHRITSSKCIKMYREKRPSYIDPKSIEEMNEETKQMEQNPNSSHRFHTDQELLSFFISCLREKEQKVIQALYLEQKSVKEISEMLDMPEGSVKSLAFKGRKNLRKLILNYEESNHIKLDFHTSAAPAIFAIPIVVTIKEWLKLHQSICMKTAQLSMAVGCAVLVVAGTEQILPELQKEEVPVLKQHAERTNDIYVFPTVNVNGHLYTNAAEAYDGLISFSSTKELVNQSKEACLEYQELVSVMEQYGGIYYKKLYDLGWITQYKEKMI